MKIKAIRIRSGISKGDYDFGNVSIITSVHNKAGKTTLLRCILFALGYPIPSMSGMAFDRMEFSVSVITNDNKDVTVFRRGATVEVLCEANTQRFSLPVEQHELHRILFGIEDATVLDNLLGVFYFDQEKGWTLLNRGNAIAHIHFSIEDLLRGLTGKSCQQERNKLKTVEDEIKKYRYMQSVAQYKSELTESVDAIPFETPAEEIMREILRLRNERKPIETEIQHLKKAIRDTIAFERYVNSMQLRVKCPCGHAIPVSSETIVELPDTRDFLKAKLADAEHRISKIDNQIGALNERQAGTEMLVSVETTIQRLAEELSHVSIDAPAVERILTSLYQQRTNLQAQIKDALIKENDLIKKLTDSEVGYLAELGIDEKFGRNVFTSDLKAFSGTIYHLQVFAFKLSYVKLVREKTGCILPLLIDSPNGREVEKEVVQKMMEILIRDFSNHQIIIATIYKPDPPLPEQSIICLEDGVLHLAPAENASS